MVALAEKFRLKVAEKFTHKEESRLFDPGELAALEIAWRTSEGIDGAIVYRAKLTWLRDRVFGLSQENAVVAAYEEILALHALTPKEKRLRYAKHFDAVKQGTSLKYDSVKAAKIIMKTNGVGYAKDPMVYVQGVADLHQLEYGMGAEKTGEMLAVAENYGLAIKALIGKDYRSAEKSFERFYMGLHSILLATLPPQSTE